MARAQKAQLRRQMLILSLMGGCGVLAILYAYFLNVTIVDSMHIDQGRASISKLSTHVSDLEQKYFVASNAVTLQYARSLGFKDTENPIYIARAESAKLSFKNEN